MKLNYETSTYPGDNIFYVVLTGTFLLMAVAAGFIYWLYLSQAESPDPHRTYHQVGAGEQTRFHGPDGRSIGAATTSAEIGKSGPVRIDQTVVYKKLGISPLPKSIETLPQIQKRLEQLNREACYRDAIVDFAEGLIDVGYPREAAISLRSFVKRCKDSEDLLWIGYSALESISDYQGALELADHLVKTYPANGAFRYARARAYDHLDNFSLSLTDYLNTIQLAGDPARLSGDVFFNTSRMYARLGRYCDAITPMETYISLDPANRRTPQTTKIIAEYADQGNCDTNYASGSARIAIPGQSNVHFLRVFVNGVEGNFILDTGATFLTVSSQFASKARIHTEPANQVVMKTVGGTALADIGYAAKITIGKAEASGVVVAVHRNDGANPFGDRIDGLLGMSFLARFKLNISPRVIELTPIPLR
jgi:predicted aspartyl protease